MKKEDFRHDSAKRRITISLGCGIIASGGLLAASQGGDVTENAPPSLATVPVPGPGDLSAFIVDMEAAKRLGKALFWDMQVGSDGIQACATCHYHAGTDHRIKNQLNPGLSGIFDPTASGGMGPNYTFNAGDFPFHQNVDPLDNDSPTMFDSEDRVGPQGVTRFDFVGISSDAEDMGTQVVDEDGFNPCGVNTRRVEPRQAPTVFNAVFADRLFWDGRANRFFNGEGIWGDTNVGASILQTDGMGGAAAPISILFDHSALASQALGPVLSGQEMSYVGRTWGDVGDKMLDLAPLAKQVVADDDSLLGMFSNFPSKGINPGGAGTYREMVMAAFASSLWEDTTSTFGGLTQIEQNFDFFFGIAVQCYERTLVSDDSPYDQWAEAGKMSDGGGILSADEMAGMEFLLTKGGCTSCHGGAEFAGANVSEFSTPSTNGNEHEGRIEEMLMHDGKAKGHLTLETEDVPYFVAEDPGGPHGLLTTDPRGKLIEIRPPSGFGAPLAWGTIPSSGSAGFCWDRATEFLLNNGSNAPANSSFQMAGSFEVDVFCNMRLSFEMSWTFPGKPEGDYTVWIGGMQVGLIHMHHVHEPAFYDSGFYNIGARLTEDDIGGGGSGPFGPFSLSARRQQGDDIGDGSAPSIGPNDRIAVNGSFRAMSLRNIELTGPYMHHGGFATLEQVVEFYVGGGHFIQENEHDADPDVDGISGATTEDISNTVAFLKTLTDERVRHQRAPFDHPDIFVPNGHPTTMGDPSCPVDDGTGKATVDYLHIPGVGATGGTALEPFHAQLAPALAIGSQPNGLIIFEANESYAVTFNVALAKPPHADVLVKLGVDQSEARVLPDEILFSPEDWFVRRTITVRGVEDGVPDGNINFEVVMLEVSSQDLAWDGLEQDLASVMSVDSGKLHQIFDLEAEDAALTAPMVVVADMTASKAGCIVVPEGSGNSQFPGHGGQAEFSFAVETQATGPFFAWARTKSGAGERGAAFWIQIDEEPWRQWRIGATRSWAWSRIPIPNSNFAAGIHTVRIHNLEDGTGLDKIVISNDSSYRNSGDPSGSLRK